METHAGTSVSVPPAPGFNQSPFGDLSLGVSLPRVRLAEGEHVPGKPRCQKSDSLIFFWYPVSILAVPESANQTLSLIFPRKGVRLQDLCFAITLLSARLSPTPSPPTTVPLKPPRQPPAPSPSSVLPPTPAGLHYSSACPQLEHPFFPKVMLSSASALLPSLSPVSLPHSHRLSGHSSFRLCSLWTSDRVQFPKGSRAHPVSTVCLSPPPRSLCLLSHSFPPRGLMPTRTARSLHSQAAFVVSALLLPGEPFK